MNRTFLLKNTAIASSESLDHDEKQDHINLEESTKQEGRIPTIQHSDCRLQSGTEENEKAFFAAYADEYFDHGIRKIQNK